MHCPHCQGLIYRARRGAGHEYFTLAEWYGMSGFPRRREIQAAWCSDCGEHVCDTPRCAAVCVPFMRKIDAHFERESGPGAVRVWLGKR